MSYLALDLSKSSTGWALWSPSWESKRFPFDRDDFNSLDEFYEERSNFKARMRRPLFGHWMLGSEYSSEGQVFAKLHRNLSDLYKVEKFERLYFEEPINPAHLTGNTSIATIWLLSGLASHAQSFAAIKRLRMVKPVNVERWRKSFIGDMVVREVKAGVRRRRQSGDSKASSTDQLKRLTIDRCRQLGLNPRKNDEADALGILTYSILLDGVTPPWLANETLRTHLEITK